MPLKIVIHCKVSWTIYKNGFWRLSQSAISTGDNARRPARKVWKCMLTQHKVTPMSNRSRVLSHVHVYTITPAWYTQLHTFTRTQSRSCPIAHVYSVTFIYARSHPPDTLNSTRSRAPAHTYTLTYLMAHSLAQILSPNWVYIIITNKIMMIKVIISIEMIINTHIIHMHEAYDAGLQRLCYDYFFSKTRLAFATRAQIVFQSRMFSLTHTNTKTNRINHTDVVTITHTQVK